MNSGDAPTDLKARTGLSTPPGRILRARAKSLVERVVFISCFFHADAKVTKTPQLMSQIQDWPRKHEGTKQTLNFFFVISCFRGLAASMDRYETPSAYSKRAASR